MKNNLFLFVITQLFILFIPYSFGSDQVQTKQQSKEKQLSKNGKTGKPKHHYSTQTSSALNPHDTAVAGHKKRREKEKETEPFHSEHQVSNDQENNQDVFVWDDLPDEVKLEILGHIPVKEHPKITILDKKTHDLSEDELLWKERFRRDFPDGDNDIKEGETWKQKYRIASSAFEVLKSRLGNLRAQISKIIEEVAPGYAAQYPESAFTFKYMLFKELMGDINEGKNLDQIYNKIKSHLLIEQDLDTRSAIISFTNGKTSEIHLHVLIRDFDVNNDERVKKLKQEKNITSTFQLDISEIVTFLCDNRIPSLYNFNFRLINPGPLLVIELDDPKMKLYRVNAEFGDILRKFVIDYEQEIQEK